MTGGRLRFIPVTGMHRSGTSAVARILDLLGVALGPRDELLPAAADNPSGFWENERIMRMNDRVLHVLGGTWRHPPVRPPGWEEDPSLDELRDEASAILSGLAPDSDVAGWKDPRTSLLIPFWRSVAPIERTVLVVRHPRAVAASLIRRNALKPEQSAYLWLRYTAAAWMDDPHHVLIDYDEMLTQPMQQAERLAEVLGLETDERTEEQLRSFLRTDHRRGPPSGLGDRGALFELAEHLHQQIGRVARADLEPTMRVIADGWLSNIGEGIFPELREHLSEANERLERAQRKARAYDSLMSKRVVRMALTVSEQWGGARVPRPEDLTETDGRGR